MSSTSEETAANMGWLRLRFIVAAILLFAAAAKIANLPQILAGDGLLSNRSLLLAVISFEAGIATFLCLAAPVTSWRLTILTFAILASTASYAVITGQDCNCIAEAIKPEIMLVLDLTVLALAVWFRPKPSITPSDSHRTAHFALCLVVGVALLGSALFREHSVGQGITDQDATLEFLIAEMFVDKPWPLVSRYHPSLKSLQKGKWLVFVVRRDCEHCKEMLAEFFASPSRHRPDERTAVFLAGNSEWPFQFDNVTMDVNGENSILWPNGEPFVASPAVFLLQNGQIVDASDGEDADDFCRSLFDVRGL